MKYRHSCLEMKKIEQGEYSSGPCRSISRRDHCWNVNDFKAPSISTLLALDHAQLQQHLSVPLKLTRSAKIGPSAHKTTETKPQKGSHGSKKTRNVQTNLQFLTKQSIQQLPLLRFHVNPTTLSESGGWAFECLDLMGFPAPPLVHLSLPRQIVYRFTQSSLPTWLSSLPIHVSLRSPSSHIAISEPFRSHFLSGLAIMRCSLTLNFECRIVQSSVDLRL